MNNMLKKVNTRILSLAVTAIIAAESSDAMATQGLGDIGRNQVTTFSGLAEGLYYGALFGGIALAIAGLLQISAAHKKQESIKPGVILLIVGGAMSSVTAVIGSGSATIFGSDNSNTARLGL